ncbi:ComEA family DNA-binding protein [Pontibacter chitinilyticus]|uniref:ComEA family DNA-binding protein n=1 Tax=Pontibacter chitinilyticus TaxID=2674989 RepID=UPI00321BE369
MRKLRHWIRRYFGFSQGEVNGFLWLIGIMVLLTAAPFLLNTFYTPAHPFSSSTDQQTLDSLVAQLEASQPEPDRDKYSTYKKVPTVALHPFNPNKLTAAEWQGFGIPRFLAQRILNYRRKVGDFTYKAELGKIYDFPDSTFRRLYPYIQLPEERPDKYGKREAYAGKQPTPYPRNNTLFPPREKFILAPFNINAADTTQLKQIRGIGSKLSARIVKYRAGLGGFYSMAQLKEVYGLPPEIVDSLQKYTFVPDTYTPPQLNINTATADELKLHPYISSNVARALVAYREQHGLFEKLEDLQKIKLVKPELYDKLKPYLTL